ncbi:hypothetical protein L9F63_008795 [Diploptera punctata]|uniref:Sulfotransferase domain-containing protein n=1 Tax=Diploptera punctata TaxID=6984 RepID=A0AAD7Z4J7_DIPPU|nr:hypothetical protein L9F63_008795 [Diploptera punctata]
MSKKDEFRIEEVQSREIEEFVKSSRRLYTNGMVKIWPPGCTLFTEYKNHVERVRQLEVRPDDVWIITYPKCGTTWTQEMTWLLLNNLDFNTAKNIRLIERSPFMEFACFVSRDEKVTSIDDTLTQTQNLESPRCIKSHLPKQLLPKQLWTVKPKIIYVTREPKDVAASYYHHHRLLYGYTGSWEQFVNAFTGSYEFWKIRNEENVLITSFEEMKKNLPAVIKSVAKFLDRTLSPEQLEQLCDHLSFDSMKNNPAVTMESEMALFDNSHLGGKVQPFIRKGQVGGWKSEFTPELAQKIDKWTADNLKGKDYLHQH